MCKCKARAGRSARIMIIGFTAAAAVLWGLATALDGHVRDQDMILLTSAAVASSVVLALTVAAGVVRARDQISADAASAAYEATIAEQQRLQGILIEALQNATEDVALLPPVSEDKRTTRPFRIVEAAGS